MQCFTCALRLQQVGDQLTTIIVIAAQIMLGFSSSGLGHKSEDQYTTCQSGTPSTSLHGLSRGIADPSMITLGGRGQLYIIHCTVL